MASTLPSSAAGSGIMQQIYEELTQKSFDDIAKEFVKAYHGESLLLMKKSARDMVKADLTDVDYSCDEPKKSS